MFINTTFFIFLCIIFRLVYIGTGNIKVGKSTLAEFASARDTKKKSVGRAEKSFI